MSGWTDLRRTAKAARLDPYARVADAETILELLDERDLLAARLDLMTREARLSRESTEKAVRRAERAEVALARVRVRRLTSDAG